MPDRSLIRRFTENYIPEPNSGCWLWLGSKSGNGYGAMRAGGRTRPAHRVAYELFVGPIPEGLHIDHLCRVPCCVNPDHLEPVTNRENVLRGEGISAQHARRTHCRRHPDLPLVWMCGRRRCSVCALEQGRRYNRRVRQAARAARTSVQERTEP